VLEAQLLFYKPEEHLYVPAPAVHLDFVVPRFSDATLQGYMPRARRFGFIAQSSTDARTLAHELGHGAFNLSHTFPVLPQGTTDNLMDYNEGSRLIKPQWDLIHNPELTTGLLDDETDAASVRTDTATIHSWKDLFPNSTNIELEKISRIYDTVAVKFDSLNIKSKDENVALYGDLKSWSVRKSSHAGRIQQVAINIATKDNPHFESVDRNEIYIEDYTYKTNIDSTEWTHNTKVALHSYVDIIDFKKARISSLDALKNLTSIKVATFKLKSNNSTIPGYISPLDYNGNPSNDQKYKSLPSYRVDDYVLVAFYSKNGSNPDFVFQLIPSRSTKDYEVATWLEHIDILSDTLKKVVLTVEQLKEIFPTADTARIREVVNSINKYSDEFNINTPERMSHFLGQIGAETTGKKSPPLSTLVEDCGYTKKNIKYNKDAFAQRIKNEIITTNEKTFNWLLNPDLFEGFSDTSYFFLRNGNVVQRDTVYHLVSNVYTSTSTKHAYDGQGIKDMYVDGHQNCALFNYVYCCNKSGLGNHNVASGDGALFRGRGFIHLTGRDNYERKFFKYWKEENPNDKRTVEQIVSLLETDVDLAIKVSMIYWKYNGINQYINNSSIDSNDDEIRQVSILVNGGQMNKEMNDIPSHSQREQNTINAFNVLNKK